MLGKLTGKYQADGGLDVSAAHGGALVDAAQLGRFGRNLLEGIGDEVVDDGHALLGDTALRVHLLHDLEDVTLEGLHTLAAGGPGDCLLGCGLFACLHHSVEAR